MAMLPAAPSAESELCGGTPRLTAFRVRYPFCVVRKGPSLASAKVGTKDCGDLIWVTAIKDGFAELFGGKGYMLVDGRTLKLPMLLEPVPPAAYPLVPRPNDREVDEVRHAEAGGEDIRARRAAPRPRVLLVATSSHFVFDSFLEDAARSGDLREPAAAPGTRPGYRHHVAHAKRLLVGVGAHWAGWAFFRFLFEECDCDAVALTGRADEERWGGGCAEERWEGRAVLRGDAASLAARLRDGTFGAGDWDVAIAADGMRDVVEFLVRRVAPEDSTLVRYAYAHTFNELNIPGAPFACNALNATLPTAPFDLLMQTTVLCPSSAVAEYVRRYSDVKAVPCTCASFDYFRPWPKRHDLFDGKHGYVTMVKEARRGELHAAKSIFLKTVPRSRRARPRAWRCSTVSRGDIRT